MFNEKTKRSLNALYEAFGQHFDNYDQFKRFLTQNTTVNNDLHDALVFYEYGEKMEDQYFRFRVPNDSLALQKNTVKVKF